MFKKSTPLNPHCIGLEKDSLKKLANISIKLCLLTCPEEMLQVEQKNIIPLLVKSGRKQRQCFPCIRQHLVPTLLMVQLNHWPIIQRFGYVILVAANVAASLKRTWAG